MCLMLYSFGSYQIKCWESDDEARERIKPKTFGGKFKFSRKQWIRRYNRRVAVKEIFRKDAPIEDGRVRDAQTVIFGQAVLAALIVGASVTALLLPIPDIKVF